MRRAIIAQAALFSSALLWAVLLTNQSSLAAGSGAMVAVSLLMLTAVAIVGTLVVGGRWARRLSIGLAGSTLVLSPLVETHPALWVLGIALSGYALAEAAGTGLAAVVRRLPSASGPPVQALMIPLLALGWPALLALSQPSGVDGWDWLAATTMLLLGFWYSRALPAALWVGRIGMLVPALLSVAFVPTPLWLLPLTGAAAITTLAWTKNARIAVQPLIQRGRQVPIPAELAPSEILDAAGLDDRGRRRQ
jgi:hypothetical protein